jgi:3-methyl-2-oxobutanoate hydroxymethyltransferase
MTQIRTTDLREKKQRGEKITVLTAYDATIAALLDAAGVDVVLVGDTVGMVTLGYDTTLPVTLDAMVHHTAAVARGAHRSLIVADLPFLTYQAGVKRAVRSAGRLLQEGGAAAVKLEGGRPVLDVVRRLVDVGIPVMGHVGLQPQSVNQLGGYRRRGVNRDEADEILADAEALQMAGAFAVVLEAVPADVAQRITMALDIPTIGIGAGIHCDGQVLVVNDMLGLTEHAPPFVKRYADLARTIRAAAEEYVADVRAGRYPAVAAKSPAST